MDGDSALEAVFRDVQHGLPRQGPGTDAATLHALELCTDLPEPARVLDIGCGPGMQTLAIARSRDVQVVAVDLDKTYLAELTDAARLAGLEDRVETHVLDMADLPFGDGEFDLVWSEGSAYIMGFENALRAWRHLLRPGGYAMVSELCWLTDAPGQPIAAFFAEGYPAMTDVASRAATMEACGYEVLGHFTLPDEGWWRHYYTPLEGKLPDLEDRYAADESALELVRLTRREIEMRHQYPDHYGYEYFIGRFTPR